MRTSARRDGDAWVINGQKVFSTGAGADKNVINLYARTQAEGPHQQALSLFLVERDQIPLAAWGVQPVETMFVRPTGTAAFTFENAGTVAGDVIAMPNTGQYSDVPVTLAKQQELLEFAGQVETTEETTTTEKVKKAKKKRAEAAAAE